MAKRTPARKAASKASPRKPAKARTRAKGKTAQKRARTATRKAAARRPARKAKTKKTASRAKVAGRSTTARRASRPVRRAARPPKAKAPAPKKKAAPSQVAARPVAKPVTRPAPEPAPKRAKTASAPSRTNRRSPAVERERRTWTDAVIPGPPSALDLDRSASAARSGRRELLDRYEEHHESGPTIAGGDIDADWESAYSVGDEAPGGNNPTPDQDLVDDIGQAVGLVYEDDEELKADEKVTERDRHRWEYDPASSDDFDER